MVFPRTAVALTAEFPVGGVDGPVAVTGPALAGADGDEPAVGGGAAEAAGVPPRLLT
jgi:hypothetical protein